MDSVAVVTRNAAVVMVTITVAKVMVVITTTMVMGDMAMEVTVDIMIMVTGITQTTMLVMNQLLTTKLMHQDLVMLTFTILGHQTQMMPNPFSHSFSKTQESSQDLKEQTF